MKYLLAFLLSFTIGQKCFATEWATYYVYIQTEYVQGPWSRTDLLNQSGSYIYLDPKEVEDLLGSDNDQLASAILSHLQKATPERYKFKSSLSTLADTVIITTKDSIADFDAVKNELVASFTLNSYNMVKIIQKGKVQSFQLKDISVPYMDLVFHPLIQPKAAISKDTITSDSSHIAPTTLTAKNVQTKNTFFIWLSISALLNLIFILLLIKKKK